MAVSQTVTPPLPSGYSPLVLPNRINPADKLATDSYISDDVIAAIYSGKTQIRRRVEIYQADGKTPWNPGITPRLIDGSVTVAYDSNIRRSFNLTLDNDDGLINHEPDNGLWYDKIIKIFRGVQYQNNRVFPTVGMVGFTEATAGTIVKFLRQLGITNFVYVDPNVGTVPSNVDIAVAWSPGATGSDFSAAIYTTLQAAYLAGKNVFTVNPYATATSIPFVTSSVARANGVNNGIAPTAPDSPFKNNFQTYAVPVTVGEQLVTGVRAGALIAADNGINGWYPITYESNVTGGRWVHYQAAFTDQLSSQINFRRAMSMLQNIVHWLYTYGDTRIWETQVGEFMIDKIVEPRFPKQIQISGRDYGKKLDLYKFDKTYTYTNGLKVYDVLNAIANMAGVIKANMDCQNAILQGDVSFDRTSSGLDAFTKVTEAANLEYFFDKFGVLTVRPFLDPFSSPVTLYLKTGTDGNLVDYTKSSDDSRLKNSIKVIGLNKDGADAVWYIAENNIAGSPTSVARIGRRQDSCTSILLTTAKQCQDKAERLLSVAALESYDVSFSSLVFPWLEVGEISQVEYPDREGYPYRYLFTNFTLPLGLGPMQGSSKRVIKVVS